MFEPDENGVVAVVQASSIRRIFAFGVLGALGGLILYTTLTFPPAPIWMVVMLVFGGAVIYLTDKMRRATLDVITLTTTDVRCSSGVILARLDEIESVDRGAFAFKPSNGFILRLNTKKPRGWAPGLWWQFGNRIGVGGVTSAGQSKFMAEQIALRLVQVED